MHLSPGDLCMAKKRLTLHHQSFQAEDSTELRGFVSDAPEGSVVLILKTIDEMTMCQDWDGEQLILCVVDGVRGWVWSRHLALLI